MPACRRLLIAAVLLAAPSITPAQTPVTPRTVPEGSEWTTRSFALNHLGADAAAKLISPYVGNVGGAVYSAGSGVDALTVTVPRGQAALLSTVDSLLRVFDRAPRAVTLRFQLVVTTDQAIADPRLSDVQEALRSLFSFKGYRLLAEGTTVVGEREDFGLTMSSDQNRFVVTGEVGRLQGDANPSVHLSVGLTKAVALAGDSTAMVMQMMSMMPGNQFIRTGITMPIGKTAVLGSGTTDGQSGVLILVVRPELR
ncbi:MAG TPA: hypothetical protein VFN22_00140 [Gemmatimonadales bacterium]|nr:hypothetical protein [Gemmatimonadales bacterium]